MCTRVKAGYLQNSSIQSIGVLDTVYKFGELLYLPCIASKYQTIPDSAPHQMLETRWLRNPQYVKDTIQLYTRGGAEIQTGITYTHYVQDAIVEHAQATGDVDFLTSQLEGMIKMYEIWDVQMNESTGLYHRTPLSDAQSVDAVLK